MSDIQNIVDEYRSLGIADQVDYEKFYLYSIITHSTAIERSTITETENRVLFDDGIGINKPIAEQMMNLDLKNAYETGFTLARENQQFSVEMLCDLSGIVMRNTGSEYNTATGNFSAARGDLRLVNVSAGRGGKSYISWQKVPDRLEEFCSWLNTERTNQSPGDVYDAYSLGFEAHYKLVTIHPWVDGNGRMARLVMNMLEYGMGIPLSIVHKELRTEYIDSLSVSQDNDDSGIFIKFMMDNQVKNLKRQIGEYKHSM